MQIRSLMLDLQNKSYTFHFIRWKDFRPAIKSKDYGN